MTTITILNAHLVNAVISLKNLYFLRRIHAHYVFFFSTLQTRISLPDVGPYSQVSELESVENSFLDPFVLN